MTEPTLDELMLAYDSMNPTGVDFERLLRGGMVTMQGVPTQEGERALIRAYRSRAIGLERVLRDVLPALRLRATEEARTNRRLRTSKLGGMISTQAQDLLKRAEAALPGGRT
jgi:hypothetical protein